MYRIIWQSIDSSSSTLFSNKVHEEATIFDNQPKNVYTRRRLTEISVVRLADATHRVHLVRNLQHVTESNHHSL